MTITETAPARPRYGNFFIHRSAGIGSLGWLGSFIAAGGALLSILAVTFAGLLAMVLVLAFTGGLLSLLLFRDTHGRNLAQRMSNRMVYRRTVRSQTNLLRSGALGVIPYGECRLPGIAAQIELTEHVDAWNQPFILLETPSAGTFATVWTCDPPGSQLLDDAVIDQMVADYGGWLAGHTMEERLVAASVIIETRPDTGHRLRASVEPRRALAAPAIAVAAVNASLAQMSVGGASIRSWATATFTADPIDGGPRNTAVQMAGELSARAPLIGDALRSAGAGTVQPTTGQEMCELVRAAIDPEAADDIDAAHAAGAPIPMSWTDAGPVAHQAGWREYRHDSGLSVTWVMSRPPQGAVLSNILARLLAPHPAVAVKRVALLYRPWDIGEAAGRTEKDVNDAEWGVNNPTRGRASGSAKTLLRRAEKTDEEVAEGAGLLNFAVVVTATVIDPADLGKARAVVATLNKSAKLTMREAHGWQDTAFLYGLPLGLVPSRHTSIPEQIKERM